jgi:excisionase family DNA binding protein
MNTTIPFDQRLTCSVPEACQVASLGRTKIYELIDEGKIETRKVGAKRLILVGSLKSFLQGAGGA